MFPPGGAVGGGYLKNGETGAALEHGAALAFCQPVTGVKIVPPRQFLPFQAHGRGHIVRPMTRMRHIATTRNAQIGARFAVSLRGLLLLTLR